MFVLPCHLVFIVAFPPGLAIHFLALDVKWTIDGQDYNNVCDVLISSKAIPMLVAIAVVFTALFPTFLWFALWQKHAAFCSYTSHAVFRLQSGGTPPRFLRLLFAGSRLAPLNFAFS